MPAEPANAKAAPALSPNKRPSRWPGVVLSLLVPGFGAYRAGLTKRGVFWFAGFLLLDSATVLALAVQSIPLLLGATAFVLAFILTIIMLVDNFRLGKITRHKWLVYIACILVLALRPLSFVRVIHTFKIPTSGMKPALCPGDRFIVNRLAYRYTPLKRGDVVAFHTDGISGIPGNEIYVQRVAAFSGEKVQIMNNGTFLVNGKEIKLTDGLPHIHYTPLSYPGAVIDSEWSSYVVPQGDIFLLGDNTEHSADSRLWGGLPKANIYGQAVKIYYPFSRFGAIK